MKHDTPNSAAFEITAGCWLCGEPLASPSVAWNGTGGGISLHPMCAAKMSFGLAQDAYEVFNGKRLRSGEETAKWLEFFVAEGACGRAPSSKSETAVE